MALRWYHWYCASLQRGLGVDFQTERSLFDAVLPFLETGAEYDPSESLRDLDAKFPLPPSWTAVSGPNGRKSSDFGRRFDELYGGLRVQMKLLLRSSRNRLRDMQADAEAGGEESEQMQEEEEAIQEQWTYMSGISREAARASGACVSDSEGMAEGSTEEERRDPSGGGGGEETTGLLRRGAGDGGSPEVPPCTVIRDVRTALVRSRDGDVRRRPGGRGDSRGGGATGRDHPSFYPSYQLHTKHVFGPADTQEEEEEEEAGEPALPRTGAGEGSHFSSRCTTIEGRERRAGGEREGRVRREKERHRLSRNSEREAPELAITRIVTREGEGWVDYAESGERILHSSSQRLERGLNGERVSSSQSISAEPSADPEPPSPSVSATATSRRRQRTLLERERERGLERRGEGSANQKKGASSATFADWKWKTKNSSAHSPPKEKGEERDTQKFPPKNEMNASVGSPFSLASRSVTETVGEDLTSGGASLEASLPGGPRSPDFAHSPSSPPAPSAERVDPSDDSLGLPWFLWYLQHPRGLGVRPGPERHLLQLLAPPLNAQRPFSEWLRAGGEGPIPLPPGWDRHVDDQGRVFFWRRNEEESTWRHPDHETFQILIGLYRSARVAASPHQRLEDLSRGYRGHIKMLLKAAKGRYREHRERVASSTCTDQGLIKELLETKRQKWEEVRSLQRKVQLLVEVEERLHLALTRDEDDALGPHTTQEEEDAVAGEEAEEEGDNRAATEPNREDEEKADNSTQSPTGQAPEGFREERGRSSKVSAQTKQKKKKKKGAREKNRKQQEETEDEQQLQEDQKREDPFQNQKGTPKPPSTSVESIRLGRPSVRSDGTQQKVPTERERDSEVPLTGPSHPSEKSQSREKKADSASASSSVKEPSKAEERGAPSPVSSSSHASSPTIVTVVHVPTGTRLDPTGQEGAAPSGRSDPVSQAPRERERERDRDKETAAKEISESPRLPPSSVPLQTLYLEAEEEQEGAREAETNKRKGEDQIPKSIDLSSSASPQAPPLFVVSRKASFTSAPQADTHNAQIPNVFPESPDLDEYPVPSDDEEDYKADVTNSSGVIAQRQRPRAHSQTSSHDHPDGPLNPNADPCVHLLPVPQTRTPGRTNIPGSVTLPPDLGGVLETARRNSAFTDFAPFSDARRSSLMEFLEEAEQEEKRANGTAEGSQQKAPCRYERLSDPLHANEVIEEIAKFPSPEDPSEGDGTEASRGGGGQAYETDTLRSGYLGGEERERAAESGAESEETDGESTYGYRYRGRGSERGGMTDGKLNRRRSFLLVSPEVLETTRGDGRGESLHSTSDIPQPSGATVFSSRSEYSEEVDLDAMAQRLQRRSRIWMGRLWRMKTMEIRGDGATKLQRAWRWMVARVLARAWRKKEREKRQKAWWSIYRMWLGFKGREAARRRRRELEKQRWNARFVLANWWWRKTWRKRKRAARFVRDVWLGFLWRKSRVPLQAWDPKKVDGRQGRRMRLHFVCSSPSDFSRFNSLFSTELAKDASREDLETTPAIHTGKPNQQFAPLRSLQSMQRDLEASHGHAEGTPSWHVLTKSQTSKDISTNQFPPMRQPSFHLDTPRTAPLEGFPGSPHAEIPTVSKKTLQKPQDLLASSPSDTPLPPDSSPEWDQALAPLLGSPRLEKTLRRLGIRSQDLLPRSLEVFKRQTSRHPLPLSSSLRLPERPLLLWKNYERQRRRRVLEVLLARAEDIREEEEAKDGETMRVVSVLDGEDLREPHETAFARSSGSGMQIRSLVMIERLLEKEAKRMEREKRLEMRTALAAEARNQDQLAKERWLDERLIYRDIRKSTRSRQMHLKGLRTGQQIQERWERHLHAEEIARAERTFKHQVLELSIQEQEKRAEDFFIFQQMKNSDRSGREAERRRLVRSRYADICNDAEHRGHSKLERMEEKSEEVARQAGERQRRRLLENAERSMKFVNAAEKLGNLERQAEYRKGLVQERLYEKAQQVEALKNLKGHFALQRRERNVRQAALRSLPVNLRSISPGPSHYVSPFHPSVLRPFESVSDALRDRSFFSGPANASTSVQLPSAEPN
uniref:WW domain-containing protein n=1 Tax=Chromera velia CCMP2878 TaxID=1169474 RepID=A0A0G4HD00_9ALVE|eukprot:Cvel_26335.t1-p1 / transcript=Cvel_26335.t1 / gene=Cvel_26335 / organism=Chromera_velia_CCMP2878 / gene_product=hypothetical protein / transcript_product=hypothetical protein / location=Cvel_scaffold3116:2517-16550(-) / protein_length=2056 / sequence_SO=supercontig / SO=protein_coding / is_pseudo=false